MTIAESIDEVIEKIEYARNCAEYEESIETLDSSRNYYNGKKLGLQVALNIIEDMFK